MKYELNKNYYLSTDGYRFTYRQDKYNPSTIHVEMFKSGEKVHKQIAASDTYGINKDHHEVINELESKIALNQLDPTGLKQIITS